MDTTDSPESPLERVAAGVASPRATEAFAILGHEIRPAILLALWDAYDPLVAETTVPFAELRKRVGVRDGSQFNHHLKQLVGLFVRKTEAEYELQRAGLRLVQTVIAGAGLEDPAFAPTEIDSPCYLCGAPTAVTYHDESAFWVCTECDGLFGNRFEYVEGVLGRYTLDPAGVTDRRPEAVYNAALISGTWRLQSAIEGVCIACSGPMDGWLHVCDEHVAEGVCPTCKRRAAVIARFRCSICKNYARMVPWCLVIHHPAVIAFYADHGVPLQYEGDDAERFHLRRELLLEASHDQELIAEDPPRVRVTIQYDGDELRLTLDENLDVVEVNDSN